MAFTAFVLCNPNNACISALLAAPTLSIFLNIHHYIHHVLYLQSTKNNHHNHHNHHNHDHLLPSNNLPTPPQSTTSAFFPRTNPASSPTTVHPLHTPNPNKMCKYTYTLFTCGHGSHIFAEDIELCPTHRLLSAHGPSPYDGLECPSSVGTCEGVNDWLCDECTEVWDLEAGCEREG